MPCNSGGYNEQILLRERNIFVVTKKRSNHKAKKSSTLKRVCVLSSTNWKLRN